MSVTAVRSFFTSAPSSGSSSGEASPDRSKRALATGSTHRRDRKQAHTQFSAEKFADALACIRSDCERVRILQAASVTAAASRTHAYHSVTRALARRHSREVHDHGGSGRARLGCGAGLLVGAGLDAHHVGRQLLLLKPQRRSDARVKKRRSVTSGGRARLRSYLTFISRTPRRFAPRPSGPSPKCASATYIKKETESAVLVSSVPVGSCAASLASVSSSCWRRAADCSNLARNASSIIFGNQAILKIIKIIIIL